MERPEILKRIGKFCVSRERCEMEVQEKLTEWDIPEHDLYEIIAILKKENLLNEGRYVKAVVEAKFRGSGWGKIKIRQYLEYHNINNTTINQALQEISTEEYKALACNMAKKSKDPGAAYRSLISKGFEEELINDIFQQLKLNEI